MSVGLSSFVFLTVFNLAILLFIIADFVILSLNSSVRCAVVLTIAWIIAGLGFSAVIYGMFGINSAYDYLTAYFVEKSLSIDNIFIFFLIFSQFGVERKYQHKLLFIGIWSALILRAIMIFAVGKLLSVFSWMIYVFGGLILYAGLQSFREKKKDINSQVQFIKKYIHVYDGEHRGNLFIYENGKLHATILLVIVFFIEFCDIVFAFDSIPALFSVTSDKLIIYTSNALAIIGLRSLYMSFAAAVDRFRYLKYGVGVILCLVGLKMLFADFIHISSGMYLLLISLILTVAFIASKVRLEEESGS